VTILPHKAKTLLELFCFQLIAIGERQNSASSAVVPQGKKIHGFT